MQRIRADRLDYREEDSLYCLDDVPVTGVAFTPDGPRVRSEAEYRDGLAWGVSRSWHPSGAPASEKQTAGGVWHGLCQEWDEAGRLTLYEVYELGVCVWRQRWAAGALAEDWRLAEPDGDFATLQMLRRHFMRGLAELGRG